MLTAGENNLFTTSKSLAGECVSILYYDVSYIQKVMLFLKKQLVEKGGSHLISRVVLSFIFIP